jgi:hypothetical protein
LFRIGADGRARQIRGQNVHPGAAYIFVSAEGNSAMPIFAAPCTLECEGVHAVRIAVPQNVSTDDASHLQVLGLKIARTVHVWPAGLPCRSWDGEGQSEWLTTEQPQFGIVHDHPVQSYLVCLDDEASIEIDAPASGDPIFVQLDRLRAGNHRLAVTARRRSPSGDEPLSGYVDLKVREPEPWIPGVPAHTGLVVSLDPFDANLDEFWGNKLDLSIHGPESHEVSCTVSLENSAGEQILSENVDGSFPLPVIPSVWRTKFANVVGRDENEWRYLEASSGKLQIRGGELGSFVLRFERDTLPLRWITRNLRQHLFLRLIDDTGLEDSEATCHYYLMEQPLKAEQCSTTEMLKGFYPPAPGALYFAKHGPFGDALIVSSGLGSGEGLRALGVTSDCSAVLSGEASVAMALRVLGLWSYARLVGSLAEVRKNRIAAKLHTAIYEKLCGANWARAESKFTQAPTSKQAEEELLCSVGRSQGFRSALRVEREKFRGEIAQTINWYAELSRRYGVCTDPVLCEFAVILARKPNVLPDKYPAELERLTTTAVSHTELLRGARFADLLNSTGSSADESGSVVRRRQWF